MGEGQIGRILAKRPLFDRIFHANRKGAQYGVSRECLTSQEEKRRPIWAYFVSGTEPGPAWFHQTFLVTTGFLDRIDIVKLFQKREE
jgi:hypothetical protein